jgi:hypothetical protein
VQIELTDLFHGLLEGGPHMVRRFQLARFDAERGHAGGGWYLHDRASIEDDVASGIDEWLPRARAKALLGPHATGGRRRLTVVWFQHWEDDPFERLAAIVRTLPWPDLSKHLADEGD